MTAITDNIIEMKAVSIEYKMKKYNIRAIDHVELPIRRGKVTALVGESGSGKTTLMSALLRCISEPGEQVGGEILFYKKEGENGLVTEYNVGALTEEELNAYRWGNVSMVFQGAQSALNPVVKIYDQFYETAYYHDKKVSRQDFDRRVRELMDIVHLDPDKVLKAYPHELSGGMKQRVMIAFSLLLNPDVIILDEPTTALDVITQDYIFKILREINESMGITMILLTHDIGIVAKFADYVGVMYAGRLMEYGDVFTIFRERMHPYTEGLIRATPSLAVDIREMSPIEGATPDLMNLPGGCVFHPRCGRCVRECAVRTPETVCLDETHKIMCHLYGPEGGKGHAGAERNH